MLYKKKRQFAATAEMWIHDISLTIQAIAWKQSYPNLKSFNSM